MFGNVQVTTQALHVCFDEQILVCYFSGGGWLRGLANGLPSKHVRLRTQQLLTGPERQLELAKAFVVGKIRNSRTLLRRNARSDVAVEVDRLAAAVESARAAVSVASLLGVEGAAARTYFSVLAAMVRADAQLPGAPFGFEGRNRRPPRDAVNALLSFVYALLVKDLVAAAIGVGFDPYIGFYHRPRFGRPALALDLAEEFRPLLGDSTVLTLINNGEIKGSDFVVRAGGVALTTEGRKGCLSAYERRLNTEVNHPVFGYRVTYRRAMEVQVRLLGAYLLNEVPSYSPFTTR